MNKFLIILLIICGILLSDSRRTYKERTPKLRVRKQIQIRRRICDRCVGRLWKKCNNLLSRCFINMMSKRSISEPGANKLRQKKTRKRRRTRRKLLKISKVKCRQPRISCGLCDAVCW